MQTKLSTVRKQGQLASLDSILAAAGADLWSAKAICAHRAHELAKAPPPNKLWKWRPLIARAFTGTQGIVCGVGLLSVLGIAAGSLALAFGAHATLALGSLCVFVVSVGTVFALERLMNIKIRPPAEWEMRAYHANYEMPARAHELVRDIKDLLPGSAFLVHELMQDRVVLDPILEVSAKDPSTGKFEVRPVLVWDVDGKIVSPPL